MDVVPTRLYNVLGIEPKDKQARVPIDMNVFLRNCGERKNDEKKKKKKRATKKPHCPCVLNTTSSQLDIIIIRFFYLLQ